MTTMHIYTAPTQPATGWIDTHSGEPIRMGFEPEKLIHTDCCREKLPAKDLVVQSLYGCLRVFCAEGKGCKDMTVFANKKARAFKNRSEGQKARWARII